MKRFIIQVYSKMFAFVHKMNFQYKSIFINWFSFLLSFFAKLLNYTILCHIAIVKAEDRNRRIHSWSAKAIQISMKASMIPSIIDKKYFVKDCSTTFGKSLTHLSYLWLSTKACSTKWKGTRICPVLKSGHKSDFGIYRSVAL